MSSYKNHERWKNWQSESAQGFAILLLNKIKCILKFVGIRLRTTIMAEILCGDI